MICTCKYSDLKVQALEQSLRKTKVEKNKIWSPDKIKLSILMHKGRSKFNAIQRCLYAQTSFLLLILCVCLVAQPCPTLCDPLDCGPPGSSVCGIFQARLLGYIFLLHGIFPAQGSNPRHFVSCTGHQILHHCTTWKARTPHLILPFACSHFLLTWEPFSLRTHTSPILFGKSHHKHKRKCCFGIPPKILILT